MAKITKGELLGKTKTEVQKLILAKFNAGNLSQKEFNIANGYLAQLNSGEKVVDQEMVDNLFRDLGIS